MAIKAIKTSVAFEDGAGNVVTNGLITLTLNQDATASIGGGGQIVPADVKFAIDANGLINAGTPVNLWANDQLTPAGTFYTVNIYNSNGLRVGGPMNWTIAGTSPIDVSLISP